MLLPTRARNSRKLRHPGSRSWTDAVPGWQTAGVRRSATQRAERRVYLLEVGSDAGPRSISESALSRSLLACHPDEALGCGLGRRGRACGARPFDGVTPIRLRRFSPTVMSSRRVARREATFALKGFEPRRKTDPSGPWQSPNQGVPGTDRPTTQLVGHYSGLGTHHASTEARSPDSTSRVRSRLFVMRGVGTAEELDDPDCVRVGISGLSCSGRVEARSEANPQDREPVVTASGKANRIDARRDVGGRFRLWLSGPSAETARDCGIRVRQAVRRSASLPLCA